MRKCWRCEKSEGTKTFWESRGIRPYCEDCFKVVLAEKQKLRTQDNGFLPDWYSKREFKKKSRPSN